MMGVRYAEKNGSYARTFRFSSLSTVVCEVGI
jgi:hypothetical protein